MPASNTPKLGNGPWFFGAVIFAVLLLSRAPQLLGPHLALDGDEAIVGLMARDLLAGEAFPTFFYGQAYGVATFEVLCVALMFLILGPGVMGIKLGSLLVFGIGILPLAAAARTWSCHRAAWFAAAACIAMPAWSQVSMRGWGINLSAWICVNISLLLIARLDTNAFPARRVRDSALLGIMVGLTLLTQPLAVLGLAPFIAWIAIRQENIARTATLAGLLLAGGAAWLLAAGQDAFWSPAIFDNRNPVAAMAQLPERIWVANSGVYQLGTALPIGPWITLSGALWLVFYLVVVVHFLRITGSVTRGPSQLARWAPLVAVGLSAGVTLFINPEYFGFRYLLWPTPYLALLAAFWMDYALASQQTSRRIAIAAALTLAVSSGVSLASMRQVTTTGYEPNGRVPEPVALESLVERLRELEVRHVYSTDAMFQWVLMFASNQDIRARWVTASDRLPEIPPSVDHALRSGQRVALVAPINHGDWIQRIAEPKAVEFVSPHHVLWRDPSEKQLRQLGFDIPDPRTPYSPPRSGAAPKRGSS